MLETLRIENLGVIAHSELSLSSGLTVLTGETGAGKTMAVTSLQLLLGAKADPQKVRHGSQHAHVEGTFVVPATSNVVALIDDIGGSYDIEGDKAIIFIARDIPAQGRSRAFVGGRSVPLSTLSEISSQLVNVHGQMDQLRLISPAQQRHALDSFGGDDIARAHDTYSAAYQGWLEACKDLEEFDAHIKESARERLVCEVLVSKIESVKPERREEESLKAEAIALEKADDIFRAYDGAASALMNEEADAYSAVSAVATAVRLLQDAQADAHLIERLSSVQREITDIAQTLNTHARHSHGDPARLNDIYERRNVLRALRKELGMDLDQALDEAEDARVLLDNLADPVAERERREKRVADSEQAMLKAGEQLRELRRSYAQELRTLVHKELRELSLRDARFNVTIEDTEPSPSGIDTVAFTLASHSQAPAAPLGKSASGGELSRIMLAVEVCLAQHATHAPDTFLFDEIDAGVGGKAALAVGNRLAQLAKHSQVIVVTHLAQVAAYAQCHVRVEKEKNNEVVQTTVSEVKGEAREEELARMLSGSDSATARAHAAELLRTLPVA